MTFAGSIRMVFNRLWRADRILIATSLLMLAALTGSLVGLVVDPRVITGAPAWLKPAKFAASMTIYMVTLAWMFTYLEAWPRVRRFVGLTTAGVMVLEMAIIGLQAWRGTTSHFNISTPFDAVLFSTMGTAIVVQTVTSVLVAVALWRQSFADRALGWAFRLGMTLTIVGAFTGGLMVRPTEEQRTRVVATRQMPIIGAHTVGAPDGGPGLPGTGWSREHGDLRIAHFLGLHATQALPLLALGLWRRRIEDARRVRLVMTAGLSYGALYAITLWQALRGQSIVDPDFTTQVVLLVWIALTGVGALWTFRWRRPVTNRTDATLNWINP